MGSTLGVMYSGASVDLPAETLSGEISGDMDVQAISGEEASGEGVPSGDDAGTTLLQKSLLRSITPAAALAYMVFILLYFPCIATFVAIRNESGSWKWAVFSAVYTICLAWVMAFAVYRLALLF